MVNAFAPRTNPQWMQRAVDEGPAKFDNGIGISTPSHGLETNQAWFVTAVIVSPLISWLRAVVRGLECCERAARVSRLMA